MCVAGGHELLKLMFFIILSCTDMDLDLAIRASRHGITYWTEDDVESCLIQSMAMNTAEEKSKQ